MDSRILQGRIAPLFVMAAALVLSMPGNMFAQGGRGGPPPAPLTPKANAPEDLTGYWVALVTEDWRFRMVTPAKGDYASVPLNGAGRAMANTWDPDKDIAAGEQCKSYGAPGLMRVPGRVHITWQDEKHFKGRDGFRRADPDFPFQRSTAGGREAFSAGLFRSHMGWPASRTRSPRTDASRFSQGSDDHLKPGYLRKNGVPYSANTVLTEYYSRTNETDGTSYLIITTIVDDPMYLAQPFITSTHFKMEPNGAKWMPMPCEAK